MAEAPTRSLPIRPLYEYARSSPPNRVDPSGHAESPAARDKGWEKWESKDYFTVRMGTCCYEVRLSWDYEVRFVESPPGVRVEWRNLVFRSFKLGEKTECTGDEVGELASAKGPWLDWRPPFRSSGNSDMPAGDIFGATSPAGTEAAATAAPQMQGD
jgi:hypothetical protein